MGITRAAVGVVAGLGLVGAGYAGLGGQDDTIRTETGEIVEGGDLGAFRIRVGDCFNQADLEEVEEVAGVPCTAPHDAEAYFAFNIPGDVFPGEAAMAEQAEAGCLPQFDGYVGKPFAESVLYLTWLRPTQGSWDELDDREVLCMIISGDESKLTGSAKGLEI